MRGNPSIEARGGLKVYMDSLGESYEVVDAIMKNDIIIHKAAHIRRALGDRYSFPTCQKWADQWIKEHKHENEPA
jgi:hypothetical protein